MEMNFNGNEFSASINSSSEKRHSIDFENGKKIINENGSIVFSVIALVLSLINLPFGLFMNLSTVFLRTLTDGSINHWISVLLVTTSIVITLSILCGVVSIVLFSKAKKTTSSCIGLALAIISFVLCAVCLGLNIAGLAVW